MTRSARIKLIIFISGVIAIITAFLPRIPQDPNYHHFADQRTLWGVSNARPR